jgi:hypothetical protein
MPLPTIELDIPRSARERAFKTLAHEIARDNIVTDALQRLIEQIIREVEETRSAPLRAEIERLREEIAALRLIYPEGTADKIVFLEDDNKRLRAAAASA